MCSWSSSGLKNNETIQKKSTGNKKVQYGRYDEIYDSSRLGKSH